MIVGVPKELLNNENRVGITPNGVHALVSAGHQICIENNAGLGSGITDEEYKKAGASICAKEDIFQKADLICKVKEALPEEYELFREEQMLYTYLHLASNEPFLDFLLKKNITSIGYETVQLDDGYLPLLAPMSEVAGRLSIQIGAYTLQKSKGGEGILIGGVPGVAPAEVVIVGGGIVGTNAARIASGMGASVTIFDINRKRLGYLDDIFAGRITTMLSDSYSISDAVKKADLLIGAVLIPGAKAPKLVSKEMVKTMKPGSVILDVAVDQGGCIETVDHVTTHDDPTYEKYGVIHYAVANMPGAVPRTSTYALTGSTLGYMMQLANKGVVQAAQDDDALRLGINTYQGKVTCKTLADSLKP